MESVVVVPTNRLRELTNTSHLYVLHQRVRCAASQGLRLRSPVYDSVDHVATESHSAAKSFGA